MTRVVAIIPARGGSKGIPNKNIINIAGLPLIAWSILQAKKVDKIESVWVTSDDNLILDIASKYGANTIQRPKELSGDLATSESAWSHAVSYINDISEEVDIVVGMQATSPIREPSDLLMAITKFENNGYDSMLSVCRVEDFFIWEMAEAGPRPVNYDLNNRRRRQNIEPKFIENGSFYIFKSKILTEMNNRLGGRVGMFEVAKHKMFQIDEIADIRLCEAVLEKYQVKNDL